MITNINTLRKSIRANIEQNRRENPFFKIVKENSHKKTPQQSDPFSLKMQRLLTFFFNYLKCIIKNDMYI